MTHEEIVDLIREAVDQPGGRWADFGAGTGNFTRALGELLGLDANLFAIDLDAGALALLKQSWREPAELHTIPGDFTKSLNLAPFDGILIANALHFVADQAAALTTIVRALRPGGRLIVIEYTQPMPWTPHPIPFDRLTRLAAFSGLTPPQRIAIRESPRTGSGMYAALALKA